MIRPPTLVACCVTAPAAVQGSAVPARRNSTWNESCVPAPPETVCQRTSTRSKLPPANPARGAFPSCTRGVCFMRYWLAAAIVSESENAAMASPPALWIDPAAIDTVCTPPLKFGNAKRTVSASITVNATADGLPSTSRSVAASVAVLTGLLKSTTSCSPLATCNERSKLISELVRET